MMTSQATIPQLVCFASICRATGQSQGGGSMNPGIGTENERPCRISPGFGCLVEIDGRVLYLYSRRLLGLIVHRARVLFCRSIWCNPSPNIYLPSKAHDIGDGTGPRDHARACLKAAFLCSPSAFGRQPCVPPALIPHRESGLTCTWLTGLICLFGGLLFFLVNILCRGGTITPPFFLSLGPGTTATWGQLFISS